MKWPKYWSFSFSISPSNEHSGLISFRMDWLDLLAVQGTLKGLLQQHSLKALILKCSAFFTVQLSRPYMSTGKTIALTRGTFVGKVMCLHFNMLSRLVITFLPTSKRLLISWLQSPSAMILEPKKIKSDTVSTVSPSISHEVITITKLISHACMRNFFSHILLFVALWTIASQAPLSIAFSRQEYWGGLLCPPPGDLLDSGLEPMSLTSPALAGGLFTTNATWEVH